MAPRRTLNPPADRRFSNARVAAVAAPAGTGRALLTGLSLVLAAAALWPTGARAQGTAPNKKPVVVSKSQVKPASVKTLAKSAVPAAAVTAAATLAIEAPLTESELAVAAQVHLGALPCELGKVVRMEQDATTPGFFRLHIDQQRYRLRPVESRTGAVRLEDAQQGVVWIQLANKSMLMSQKLGRRLADECAGESQQRVAAALKINPAPSLLEPLPVPAAAPALAAEAPAALPTPAVVATECRRNLNTTSLPSGVEPC